ncbi:zinc metalloproteinase nas-14-like [Battus philenor]|uniref:zinc metalloproteinase nas-14-like n=1 Tax=Battus philenor TaxID=42288 RepID=UPI0035D0FD92
MPACLFRKCIVFICLFYICPKVKFKALAVRSNIYRPNAKHSQSNDFSVSRRSFSIIRDEDNLPNGLSDMEPGFNLTEEEMVKFKIWPQGIIPYYIDDFSFDKVLRDKIRNFLDLTNKATGLRFMELPAPPVDENTRWVLFVNRQGLLNCADHTTKDYTNNGVQKVVLGYDCLAAGGELAEAILALVGVPPQHNSPDRDKFIKIIDKNILPEKKHLFIALKNDEWLFHDIPYDFLSAGHYGLHKYTMNGFATIQFLKPRNILIGEGRGFSYNDIWKIRMLYNFMSRKKLNFAKTSDCVKLFEPGTNFSKYQPLLEDKIEPRNKPNKYLGLPDIKPSGDGDNKTDDENKSKPEKDIKDDDENNKDAENVTVSNERIEGEKDKRPNNAKEIKKSNDASKLQKNSAELSEETDKSKKQSNRIIKLSKPIRPSKDPFHDISDYESWETTKTLKRIFTKIKG